MFKIEIPLEIVCDPGIYEFLSFYTFWKCNLLYALTEMNADKKYAKNVNFYAYFHISCQIQKVHIESTIWGNCAHSVPPNVT